MFKLSLFGEIFEQEKSGSEKIWSVTTGIVTENWNEEMPGKVKVQFVLGTEGKNVSGWIPVMTPYGGNAYGMYALPEIGAMVVVAFLMGDRNYPIVIGSLWNDVNALPAETAKEQNTLKRFQTKGGCQLIFSEEEEKAVVTLKTPGGLALEMADEGKTITVGDAEAENGYKIDAKNGTVTITAKSKMELKIGDTAMVTLDGSSKTASISGDTIKAEGSQALQLSGQNTTMKGSMVKVSADSTFSAESSGIAKIKGSMVQIN